MRISYWSSDVCSSDLWLGRDFVLPLPGGQGTARLTDANNCFNLNSLDAETMPGRLSQRAGAVGQFTELLLLLGGDRGEAQGIAGDADDWSDSEGNEGRQSTAERRGGEQGGMKGRSR